MHTFEQILQDAALWKNWEEKAPQHPLGHDNPRFLFGVATSMYQDSGARHCPHSQWSDWEKNKGSQYESSGSGVNLFELYQHAPEEVMRRLQSLSVNTYRFSIEWSHIEPEPGVFHDETLQTYIQFCRMLRDHQIQPFITLHHFSEPLWFHQKGSFEKENNIADFVRFCQKVFVPLTQDYRGGPLVEYFCTINEPSVEAYARYLIGHFPPNFKGRFRRGAQFLLHMLKAHCQVYTSLKALAKANGNLSVKIGMSHQYLRFYPRHFLLRPAAFLLNKFHWVVLNFFQTGMFDCKIPFLCRCVEKICDRASPKGDFVGVQFYGRIFLGLKGIDPRDKPKTTMMGIHEDPEGLFEAIVTTYQMAKIPVIISENGISTPSDPQRARYLSRALVAAEQARNFIGSENMLGYILWSFSDNYEWFFGWKPQFGAFGHDAHRVLCHQYKPGVQPFVDTIHAWKQSVSSLLTV